MVDIAQVSESPAEPSTSSVGDWVKKIGAALSEPPSTAGDNGASTNNDKGKEKVEGLTSVLTAEGIAEAENGKPLSDYVSDRSWAKKYMPTTSEALADTIESAVSDVTRNHLRNGGWRPGSAEALAEKIDKTVKDVFGNPKWDQRFRDDIRLSDRNLKQHPQIDAEIKKATMELKNLGNIARTLEGKYDTAFASLPGPVQEKLLNMEKMKGGDKMIADYLKDNYPDVYKNRLNMRAGQGNESNAAGALQKLENIKDQPIQARMARAEFLLQRGAKGDMASTIDLLGQIVNKDPSAATSQHLKAMRDLVQRSGAMDDPVFNKILKDNEIDASLFGPRLEKNPKFHFLPHFPEHDLHKENKVSSLNLPDLEIACDRQQLLLN